MTLGKKILLSWGVALAVAGFAYAVLPHMVEKPVALAMYAFMALASIVTIISFVREPNPKNKPLILNFAVFFTIGALQFVHLFVGRAFLAGVQYANFYSFQYLTMVLFPLAQTFAVVFVVIDSFFRDIRVWKKYAVTLVIAGGVFAYYYHPFIVDPRHSYKTPEVRDFVAVDRAVTALQKEGVADPTPAEVANRISLPAWKEGLPVGSLFADAKLRRVREIYPYLEGNNFILLVNRPLYMNVVYLNILCIFFVLIFFGYQYQKDPPQGAYIEKIVFLFLPFASFEVLHYFSYVKSVEFETFQHFVNLGHYLTFMNLLLLVLFFSLRLSFITSIKGEFYERELVSDAEHISRWRDGIDNLVVRHFLNPETFHGRLFTPRPTRTSS
jgi:hypothetical protein